MRPAHHTGKHRKPCAGPHPSQQIVAACLLVALTGAGGCAPPTAYPSKEVIERLRTPEGYAEWNQHFEELDRDVAAAKDAYARAESIRTLEHRERAVRAALDQGFLLIRAYSQEEPTPAERDILAGLIPDLNRMAHEFMDVAEDYVRQQNLETGTALAMELIIRYQELPLLAPQLRAQTLVFEYGERN